MDFSFNLADLPEPTNDFSPIPAGEYQATIKDAELKLTKNGMGQYIKLKIQVDGPTHQNRVIFSNLNIRNQNETAQSIGQAQLGQIMRAAGISSVTDPDQLIGTTLLIKVAIREAQNGYEAQNEVKGYKSMTGSAPPPLNAAKPAAKKSAAGAPPWAAKG
jgi:hypothetical protein